MNRRAPRTRWWLDLPIRYKGLLVVALPLIAVIATLVLRAQINRQQEETTALFGRAATTRDTTQELLLTVVDLEAAVRGYLVTRDRSRLARFENAKRSLPGRLEALSTMVAGTRDEPLYAKAATLANTELALATELIALLDSGASAENIALRQDLGKQDQIVQDVRNTLGALRRSHDGLVEESRSELQRLRRRLRPIIFITFVGGLLGASIAGWLFATGIARRVTALERNAERLARGERLMFEPSRGIDEIGSLDKTLRRASLLLRRRDRELRALNRELQRNVHEQALLNHELEAFSYSVSHDLRAPLRSIDGFAQALREDWGDRLDEAAQDHLSRVRNAAQRMGRLIDDLLKLSKLTRAQVQRTEVDLTRVAREVCADLTERNPTRQVTWQIGEGLHAWCDPSLARVLLENLLGNAWKFTSKIADARIEFLTMPDSNPTLFVVRDNGAGFDMKYADKLFVPFQRLHADREFPGVGIGLATVRRIVHKHGGDVRTHAEPGQGAAFYFTLEAAQQSVAVA